MAQPPTKVIEGGEWEKAEEADALQDYKEREMQALVQMDCDERNWKHLTGGVHSAVKSQAAIRQEFNAARRELEGACSSAGAAGGAAKDPFRKKAPADAKVWGKSDFFDSGPREEKQAVNARPAVRTKRKPGPKNELAEGDGGRDSSRSRSSRRGARKAARPRREKHPHRKAHPGSGATAGWSDSDSDDEIF